MSIPAILGANILSIGDALETVVWSEVPVYLAGVLVSAVVGYACIRLLRMIAEKGKFGFFAYYCWGVGIMTIILNIIQK
jgi:undecaprenyl-diphosphatase